MSDYRLCAAFVGNETWSPPVLGIATLEVQTDAGTTGVRGASVLGPSARNIMSPFHRPIRQRTTSAARSFAKSASGYTPAVDTIGRATHATTTRNQIRRHVQGIEPKDQCPDLDFHYSINHQIS